MLSWDSIKKNQPVNITGAIVHSLRWLSSEMLDVTHVHPKAKDEQGVVVYFIHGTADRASAGYLLATRLLEDMPNEVTGIIRASFDERGRGINIHGFAKQLENKILSNKHKKVFLIGHSRGGLVAAYFAEYLAKAADISVTGVVAICSPFGGSDLALWPFSWWSESVRQMTRKSDFLKDLDARIEVSEIPYFYFAAQNDGLVDIDSTCIPKHKDRLTILDRHGHLSILSSHRLVKHIQTHLRLICDNIYGKKLEDATLKQEVVPEVLKPIFDLIDGEIRAIKERYHIWSPEPKIQVLEKLKVALKILIQDQIIKYVDAKNLGEYINAYMEDSSLHDGVKPIDILTQPLNSTFSLLLSKKSGSHVFIEELIKKFTDISLSECVKSESKTLAIVYDRNNI